MKIYTIEDIKEAYTCGYYEGAGDDAWYRDHNTPDGSLTAMAFVHRTLNEYVADLTKAMPEVPTTDDEVEAILSAYSDQTLRVAALGLYYCYRKSRGLSVAEAYEKILCRIIGDKV